jgi:hypothetical protein
MDEVDPSAVDTPSVVETPSPSPQQHQELFSFADRIAQLKRRRDELHELAELRRLEDEVRMLEHGADLGESTPSRTSTPILPSSEEPHERPARRQRLNDYTPPTMGRGPKIEKIPTFEGKGIREYYDFDARLRIAFRLDPAAFVLEDQKIAYTLQYLQPTFRQLWIQREQEVDGETLEWSEMMTFLLNQIKSPVNRELQVTILYQKSVQKEGQSVNDFAAYLSTLENQINPPYEQKHLVMHLYSKLRPDLRIALSNYAEFPTTRRELVERAATLEDNLRRSGAAPVLPRRTAPTRSVSTSSSQKQEREPYRRTPFAASVRPRSNTNKDPGSCYNCGLKGHWAKDCRKRRQDQPPTTGSNSIKAKN